MKKIAVLLLCYLFVGITYAQVADKNEYLATFVAELYKQWPNNKTQNLVFHGHSVPTGYYTAAIGVKTFDSYPFYTLKSLKDKYNFAVLNCIITSIGGETARKGALRFESDVLCHKPDVVFIDYSLNDRALTLEEARAAWVSMIEAALAKNVKVMLCTPTPDLRENILSDDVPLKAHVDQVRSLAAEYKVGLVDSYEAFKEIAKNGGNLNNYMSQTNHPNAQGHRLVADEILKWFNPSSVTPGDAFGDATVSMDGSAGPACIFDYDADGLNDVVYSTGTNTNVYTNPGNNNFLKVNQPLFPAVNGGNIISVDIDNNGKKELFFSGIGTNEKVVKLLEQNSAKEWVNIPNHGLPAIYSQSNASEMENTSVCFTDINNDGYVDFLANGLNSAGVTVALIYTNNKDKTFSLLNNTNITAGNGGGITTADFDGDGYADILTWGYNPTLKGYTHLYKNNGNGTFTKSGDNFAAESWSAQVITGDFNGDGKKDFAMISWATAFFINNGDMTFTKKTDSGVANYTRCSAVVWDFNKDGADDIIVAGLNGILSETKLYTYNKTLNVFDKTLISDIGEYGCVAMGDINGDNAQDIFVSGKDRTGTVRAKFFFNTMNTTAANSVVEKKSYTIAPNPTKNKIKIIGELTPEQTVSVFDMAGKTLINKVLPVQNEVNCSSLANGSYVVAIHNDREIIQKLKITVNN